MGLKNNILMNCQQASAVVEKKRDGKLSASERIGLWIHLGYCSICRLFFQQSEIIDKSYKYYADDIDLEQKIYPLSPERKEALEKALREEMKK